MQFLVILLISLVFMTTFESVLPVCVGGSGESDVVQHSCDPPNNFLPVTTAIDLSPSGLTETQNYNGKHKLW